MVFKEVAKLSDIPAAKMKHVEINGLEILLVNVSGKVFAIDDRCGHMNAPLSMGTLDGNIVECPLHHAQFDVRTGKLVREPKIGKLVSMTPMGNLMSAVKTYDRNSYKVKIENNIINVDL